MKRLTEEQIQEALAEHDAGQAPAANTEAPARPGLEEIHPRMSVDDKQRVLDEIMRVLRGEDGQ